MGLRFPNQSRFYDATRRAVRFWGHDNAIEAVFFVTEDALRRVQPGMHLTAWTVDKRADGTVYVRINQLRDPGGLQRKLRADGVPASVVFGNPMNVQQEPCQWYHGNHRGLLPKARREDLPEGLRRRLDRWYRDAYKLLDADWGYIPLHQQSLAWGVSKKVKLTQRADNQVLLYWATKQE